MMIRQLTVAEVEFSLDVIEEDIEIKGNVLASGNEKDDREAEEWVRSQLRAGNYWAWCAVKVTARWKNFYGCDVLGCCSYEMKEMREWHGLETPADFIETYGREMEKEALNSLNQHVYQAFEAIKYLIVAK